MCFVKSGYVSHKNVVCKGLYFTAPINFCIGDVELTLKNFPGEPERTRLFILSLSGNKIYKNNISVSLKGFFGKVCPSGSIYSGELTGFAMIANITPL
jgi:hypothetical protein